MSAPTIEPLKFDEKPNAPGQLVSYSCPCPGLTVDRFLKLSQGMERFYWESDDLALAAFGVTAELTAWGAGRFQAIQQKTRQLFTDSLIDNGGNLWARPRLFGGFSFTDDFVPDNTWSIYTPAYFVLPHYQLAQLNGETWLTINATLQPDEKPDDVLPQLREALEVRYKMLLNATLPTSTLHGNPIDVKYPMPYETWERIITEATTRVKASELDKVVLSRVCEIRFAERVHVNSALEYLGEKYADCYRFLFEPRPYHAFFGATPELLAKVEGHTIETMGLAGSIRRGTSYQEDLDLANHLLNDPKERTEHALVVQAIRDNLSRLTDDLTIPDGPQVYRLSNIQHLYTPIKGHLIQAEGILSIVEMLHPTPALGGAPRDRAMDFIRQAEPVPRGWYAAPVGWIDSSLDGMFGVAIRSAVSEDRRVWLYAGAGIVGDSISQKEWDETALKFKPMLNALGVREFYKDCHESP
jgi:menaquinone-specific isochorismate synthase